MTQIGSRPKMKINTIARTKLGIYTHYIFHYLTWYFIPNLSIKPFHSSPPKLPAIIYTKFPFIQHILASLSKHISQQANCVSLQPISPITVVCPTNHGGCLCSPIYWCSSSHVEVTATTRPLLAEPFLLPPFSSRKTKPNLLFHQPRP